MILGLLHEERYQGEVLPVPPPLRIADCPGLVLASLSGYQDANGKVRAVPLDLPGPIERPTLAARIAEELGPPARWPDSGLVWFTGAGSSARPIRGWPAPADDRRLQDRFLLVSSDGGSDRLPTPFGELQGAEIHAAAARALVTGHFIQRLDRSWTFALIFALCYALTLLQARGARPWQEEVDRVLDRVVATAAVFGPSGPGRWQTEEVYAALEEDLERVMQVIPVLLPGFADPKALPKMLKRRTWIDLRSGLTPAGIRRLAEQIRPDLHRARSAARLRVRPPALG